MPSERWIVESRLLPERVGRWGPWLPFRERFHDKPAAIRAMRDYGLLTPVGVEFRVVKEDTDAE